MASDVNRKALFWFAEFCIAAVEHLDLGLTKNQRVSLYQACFIVACDEDDLPLKIHCCYKVALLISNTFFSSTLFGCVIVELKAEKQCTNVYIIAVKALISTYGKLGQHDQEQIIKERYQYVIEQCQVMKDRNLMAARLHLHKGEYSTAVHLFKSCIDFAVNLKDKKTEVVACLELNGPLFFLSQFDLAIHYVKRGLAIAQETSDRQSEWQANYYLSMDYTYIQEQHKAIDCANKAIDIAKELGDKQKEGLAEHALGTIYFGMEQFHAAETSFRESFHTANEAGDKKLSNKSSLFLLLINSQLNPCNDTFEELKRKLKLFMNTDDKDIESARTACVGLFEGYISLGHYRDAIEYGKRSLEIIKESGGLMKSTEMEVHYKLAKTYQSLNEYDNAITYFKKCFDIANEVHDDFYRQGSIIHMVDSYNSLLQIEDALRLLDTAIKEINRKKDKFIQRLELNWYRAFCIVSDSLARKFNGTESELVTKVKQTEMENDDISKLVSLRMLFVYYEDNHQLDKAIECYEKMLEMQIDQFQLVKDYCCHSLIAECYKMQKNRAKAIYHYETALSYTQKVSCKFLKGFCLNSLGKLYFKEGEFSKVVSLLGDTSYSLGEEVETFLDPEDELQFAIQEKIKIDWIDLNQSSYKLLSVALIKLGKKKDAFLKLEHYRARVLTERLMDKYGMKHGDDTEEYEQRCKNILSFATNSIKKYCFLFYLVSEMDQHAFYASDDKIELFTIRVASIQRIDDEGFIERVFVHGLLDAIENASCENRCLDSLLQTSDGQKNEEQNSIPHRSEVRGQQCKSSKDESIRVTNTLKFLYGLLIRPHSIEQEEIVVIPDSLLYNIPFAALQHPDTGQYLCETKRIRYAPSLTTLKLLEEQTSRSYRGALIIGNPHIGKVMFNGKETEQIKELPNAEYEAHAVKNVLIAPRDQCLTGADATKSAVLDRLKQGVSVIHIAAHSLLEKSTIALAPSPEVRARRTPKESDYMLTMADVQDCHIDTQLVVLSCCHSGRGETKAEGVIGMCRAFLASGARAVVASMWAIDDDFTCDFMYKFYGYLMKGNGASKSLQMTMNDSMKNEKHSHPKYWAPFFLMGDDVKLNFKGKDIPH